MKKYTLDFLVEEIEEFKVSKLPNNSVYSYYLLRAEDDTYNNIDYVTDGYSGRDITEK